MSRARSLVVPIQYRINKRIGVCSFLVLVIVLAAKPVKAGEIPGLPAALLPIIDRDFAINFSNDFLGRGGSVDDFRTQQIVLTAKINDRWLAVVDHSILTLTDSPAPGRVDQLSGSLGYHLINESSAISIDRLTIGGGFRSVGEFAGERIQNGFHRLIGSNIDSLAYVDTSTTDATGWFEAQRYRELRTFGNWTTGYWLRAGSLLTTDGQWDSTAGAFAVANRSSIDIWLGVRRDWRSGYDADNVQIETARAEDDTAVVIGVRFGALMLETVQQLNDDASYGQISLVSSGVRSANKPIDIPRIGLEFNFLVPDVQIQLVGKLRTNWFTGKDSRWRESTLLDLRYGEPQYKNDDSLFIRSQQVTAGMEWERPLTEGMNWLSFYGSVGAGWRSEQLLRSTSMANEQSDTVGSAVVTAAAGLRFFAASLGQRWNFRIQIGLNAWVPLDDANVQLAGEQFSLQEPAIGIVLGMNFDYD
jgi:hypothetical protein